MNEQMSLLDELRGDERTVEQIPREIAKPFIERIHYSRNYPANVLYAFGLYEDRQLLGVVTYGMPNLAPLCKGIAGEKNKSHVLELNRLAIEIGKNGHNRASFLVSHSLKMLPHGTYVVSYADTGWTHIGYVYQACNFLYTGLTKKRVDTYQPSGLHPRRYDKTNHSDLHQTRNQKHRYVYLVGSKTERKRMRRELKYEVIDEYPKGDCRRYDPENPQIAIPIKVVEGRRHEL